LNDTGTTSHYLHIYLRRGLRRERNTSGGRCNTSTDTCVCM